MTKYYITAQEIANALGVSEGMGYKIIRDLNAELRQKGFITIAGKCPRSYFNTKWYGGIEEVSQ